MARATLVLLLILTLGVMSEGKIIFAVFNDSYDNNHYIMQLQL